MPLGDNNQQSSHPPGVNPPEKPPIPELKRALSQSNDGSQKITQYDKLNYFTRFVESNKFEGALEQASYDSMRGKFVDFNNANQVSYELQAGIVIGNTSGLITGMALHYFIRNHYQRFMPRDSNGQPTKASMNPFYRTFKTLASVGAAFGNLLVNLMHLQKGSQRFLSTIVSNRYSLIFGLFAFPYWLLRQYVFKTDPNKSNKYSRIGNNDGWSKYGKAAFVFGIVLAQSIVGIYALIIGAPVATLGITLAIAGSIGGIACFFASLILVPLINWLSDKGDGKLALVTDDKNKFRSNYLRSGITLGLSLGSVIGFVLGVVFLPPGFAVIGMTIGGAIGSVVFGILLSVYGKQVEALTQRITRKNPTACNPESDNNFDYTTRNLAYMCGFLFSAVFFFLPIPGGPLIAAAFGSCVGSTIGWFAAFFVMKKARDIEPYEELVKDRPEDQATLAWTQRVASGANIFSTLFSAVGFCLGMLGGPGGAVLGATLGFAIGGFTGGTVGALSDKKARSMIYQAIFGKNTTPAPQTPPTPTPLPTHSSAAVALTRFSRTTTPPPTVTPEPLIAPTIHPEPLEEKTTHTHVAPDSHLADNTKTPTPKIPQPKPKKSKPASNGYFSPQFTHRQSPTAATQESPKEQVRFRRYSLVYAFPHQANETFSALPIPAIGNSAGLN